MAQCGIESVRVGIAHRGIGVNGILLVEADDLAVCDASVIAPAASTLKTAAEIVLM